MKKIITIFLSLLCGIFAFAQQVVTTIPAYIPQNYGGQIEVIFNASAGNAGMAGATTCYAHTGVILTSGTTWQHAPTWLDNSAKYKLDSIGVNLWKLVIPNITDYYGLTEGEVVSQLAFVFRDATGAKQGKTASGGDIFIDLYDPSVLSVVFNSPTEDLVVEPSTAVSIQAASSMNANLELFVNNNSVATETDTTGLSYAFDSSVYGDYVLRVQAKTDAGTVYDTVNICVKQPVQVESIPEGMQEGINYDAQNNSVTLVLRAPLKENVFVLGDFNNWVVKNEYQMKKDSIFWWLTIPNLDPDKEYAFQYLIDGTLKVSDAYTEKVIDPWNDQYISTSVHPRLIYPKAADGLVSVLQINQPQYTWETTDFVEPSKENLIIYELLFRDFTAEGTVKAAMEKLDYLKSLGINAIELMPISEFDGNDSWGYNPNHYFAYDKAYGTRDDYKKFIDECHKRGIAVILDVVFNHATGLNSFAKMYWSGSAPSAQNPWFNVVATHPYSVFNDFNHEYSGTRQFFKRVLKYWIEEYHVDGYRFDLSKGFTQNKTGSNVANWAKYDLSRINILKDYNQALKVVKEDAFLILEHFSDYNEELVLSTAGMLPWRNMNSNYCQAAMGYSSNSNFVDSNGKGGMYTTGWVGFAESHDEERTVYKMSAYGTGDLQTNEIARLKRVPLVMAFDALIPGPKMMWQFQEMGYDYSIEENGKTGKKPIPWTEYYSNTERQEAYQKCAKIINLRTKYPTVFSEGTTTVEASTAYWINGRKITVVNPDLNIIAIGNFDASATITATPGFTKTGVWYEYLTGESIDIKNVNKTVSLAPGEVRIYTDKLIDMPVGVKEISQDEPFCSVYPTIAEDYVYIHSNNEIQVVNIYNMQGVLLQQESNANQISVKALDKGYYIMQVILDNGTSIHKINKK